MSDNLKLVEQDVETFIDPNGAPQSILAQNHQNILKQVLSKMGKYTGFPFISENTVLVFTPGTFSWEGNSMDNTSNFDIKVSKLTADLNDIGLILDTLNQGDLVHFKDYLGKSAILEYNSHTASTDGSNNDIYVVNVKATPTNLNYTYQVTEKNISIIEFLKKDSVVSDNYTIDIQANQLILLNNGTQINSVDLSLYLDDTNLARIVTGVLDANTGIVTFTRDDNTTFTIDMSSLLDVGFHFAKVKVIGGIASDFSNLETVLNAETPTSYSPFYIIDVDGDVYLVYDQDNDLFEIDSFARNKVVMQVENNVMIEEALSFQDFQNSTSRYKVFPFDFGELVVGTNVLVGSEYNFDYFQTLAGNQFSNRVIHFPDSAGASLQSIENGSSYTMKQVSQDVSVALFSNNFLGSFMLQNDNTSIVQYFHVVTTQQRTFTFTNGNTAPPLIFTPDNGSLVNTLPIQVEGSGTFRIECTRDGNDYRYHISTFGFKQSSGGSITIDNAFSSSSTNALENNVIRDELFILEGVSSQRPVNHAYRLGMAFNANHRILNTNTDQVSADNITFDRDIVIANIGGVNYVIMDKGGFDGLTYLRTGVLDNTGNVIKMSLMSYSGVILLNYRDYGLTNEIIFENTPVSVNGTLPSGYEAFEIIQGTNINGDSDVANPVDTRNTIFVLKTGNLGGGGGVIVNTGVITLPNTTLQDTAGGASYTITNASGVWHTNGKICHFNVLLEGIIMSGTPTGRLRILQTEMPKRLASSSGFLGGASIDHMIGSNADVSNLSPTMFFASPNFNIISFRLKDQGNVNPNSTVNPISFPISGVGGSIEVSGTYIID